MVARNVDAGRAVVSPRLIEDAPDSFAGTLNLTGHEANLWDVRLVASLSLYMHGSD